MKHYIVSDLVNDEQYVAFRPEDGRDKTAQSAIAEAIRLDDVISMGLTIVRPSDSQQLIDKQIEQLRPKIYLSKLNPGERINIGGYTLCVMPDITSGIIYHDIAKRLMIEVENAIQRMEDYYGGRENWDDHFVSSLLSALEAAKEAGI